MDYVQTNDLDLDAILDSSVIDPEKSLEKVPVAHKPSIDTDVSKEAHTGSVYSFGKNRIRFLTLQLNYLIFPVRLVLLFA